MKGFAIATDLAWHYTDATRLLPLLHSKALKPTQGIPYCDEPPVVWLTRSNHFEPMALPLNPNGGRHHQKLLSLQGLATAANGLLRIGIAVDARLKTFQKWKESVDIDHRTQVSIMNNAAIELGSNPKDDWLISRKPIAQSRWDHIQIAFPEDVNEQGVQTWSEWDPEAQYTHDLLSMMQSHNQCEDLNGTYCLPKHLLPQSNPLERSLTSVIGKHEFD